MWPFKQCLTKEERKVLTEQVEEARLKDAKSLLTPGKRLIT